MEQNRLAGEEGLELAELRSRIAELESLVELSRRSEADRCQIDDNLPVLVATAGLDGYYKNVNAAFERILGWSEQESLSRPFMEFIHPDDRAAAELAFERLRSGESAFDFLDRNVCKDGSYRWINWNVIYLVDRDVVFGIGQDITERKRAEDERERAERDLQASEEKFRKIFEEGPIGVALIGLDFTVRKANLRFCEMLGYTEEEVVALGIEGITHPDDIEADYHLAMRLRRDEIPFYSIEKRYVRKDGKVIWGQLTASLAHDGQGRPLIGIGMIEDVTEHKRSEEALRESEERYRLLAEAIPFPVWRCDAGGGVIECNSRWYEYTGQSPEETRGDGWMNALHPDDVERIAEEVREDVLSGEVYKAEYRLRRASDGGYRWHMARAIPRRDADGKILDWFGCATEIHDRKRKEEDLESRVRRRTAELIEANERLEREIEERKQAQETLARRTALADRRASQLQRLAVELTQAEERERRHLARVLHDHLQQILVAAKLELLKINSDLFESELSADTKRVVNLLEEAIQESRSLTVELSPPILYQLGLVAGLKWLGEQAGDNFHLPVSIDADPAVDLKDQTMAVFLFQAARELILNAAKYARASRVAIRLSPVGEDRILLTVADDGAGCNPDVLNPERGAGGFGLFSIRERLDLMGGKMEISSGPGQGMTVKIDAPCPKSIELARSQQTIA